MVGTRFKASAIGLAAAAISLFALAGSAQGAIVTATPAELTAAIIDPTATPVGGSSFSAIGVANCFDAEDDDGNGLTDFPADPGCASANDHDESPGFGGSDGVPECQDGEQQGGAGIDFGADPNCASATDADENTAGEQAAECETAADDDGDADGGVFPDDPQCSDPNDDDEGSSDECSDGDDDDGDGQIDDPDGCAFPYDDDESSPDHQLSPGAVSDTALAGFPTFGPSFAVLSSGDATTTELEGDNNGADDAGHGDLVFDLTTLRVDLDVPAAANCVRFDFRYLTTEATAEQYDDGFMAELASSNFTVDPSTEAIDAPNNFARDNGDFVTVHNATFTDAAASGTEYERATALRTAAASVAPGPQALLLSVYDEDDSAAPSAVFLDGLAYGTAGAITARGAAVASCAPGDFVAPETVIDKKPKKKTTKKKVKLRFSSNEAGASFECKIDKKKFKPCGSPKKVRAKKQGKHKFKVRAVDEVGNVDQSPAKAKWKKKPKG